MKIALISSVRVAGVHSFGWKWRAEDGKAESAETFMYFYDCCENARKRGYECRFAGAESGSTTPAALSAVKRRAAAGEPDAR